MFNNVQRNTFVNSKNYQRSKCPSTVGYSHKRILLKQEENKSEIHKYRKTLPSSPPTPQREQPSPVLCVTFQSFLYAHTKYS